ncbi:MAG: hypothetical protein V2J26_07735 [Pacificimonas sp.]|jgi:hypothetical protein|nr:hypothetical protein [Pacificimonas sp.]
MSSNANPVARRFKLFFGIAAAVSVPIIGAALAWLSASGATLGIHLVISVALAVFFSMMLAAGLMGLVFLSSESGHDQRAADEAAKYEPDDWLQD